MKTDKDGQELRRGPITGRYYDEDFHILNKKPQNPGQAGAPKQSAVQRQALNRIARNK